MNFIGMDTIDEQKVRRSQEMFLKSFITFRFLPTFLRVRYQFARQILLPIISRKYFFTNYIAFLCFLYIICKLSLDSSVSIATSYG
jgi:hypothetical protein